MKPEHTNSFMNTPRWGVMCSGSFFSYTRSSRSRGSYYYSYYY